MQNKTDQALPAENGLLAGLGRSDRHLLQAQMYELVLPRGAVLLRPGEALDTLYFPTRLVLSVSIAETTTFEPIEICVVGREGMIGWPALLGCTVAEHTATVQLEAGTALALPVDQLLAICRAKPAIWAMLLQFVHALTVQMAQSVIAHVRQPLERRLCRWLLMRHDRIEGDEMHVRHDEISANLGVRRASVTDALHLLEGKLIIRCRRSRIIIRDRGELERCAGAAYVGHVAEP